MQYGFYFNGARCIGCRTCVFACKDYHHLDSDVSFRQVYEYEGGTWEEDGEGWTPHMFCYHVSLACNHCDDPACTKVCPTGAMHKDEETGIVSVDEDRCIGCGYCQMACPYNAPAIDKGVGHSVKCDGCKDRVAEGLDPICVGSCSLRCIEFGSVDELRAKYGTVADIAPLPNSDMTHPNVVIAVPASARAAEDAEGWIANRTEIV